MSNPIIVENEEYFRLDFGSTYETVIVSPPLLYNITGEQVGTIIPFNNKFKIIYISGYYGVSVITILPHTIILIDENGVKSSNNTIFNAPVTRPVPEITFTFPNIIVPINFSTGIRVEIILERAPAIQLPLILDNTFNVIVKTSNNLVYVSSQNKIYFVPTESNTYNEWFQIIPVGDPVTILNKTYNITVGSSPYILSPMSGSSYDYLTINTFLPLVILNSEFTNTMVDNIWKRNTLYIICETTPKDIYTFNVRSADNNPIFELTTHTDLFEINSSGVLRSKGFPTLGVQTYDLIINITNGLNELISAQFKVTCYDIFSEFYFQSFMGDILAYRQLSILGEYCENSLYVANTEVKKLGDAVLMIIEALYFLIQHSINIEFKKSNNDIQVLGNIFVYGNQEDFLNFLLSKFPVMSTTSLLHIKLSSLTDMYYPFLKNFIRSFTVNPERDNIYKIETIYGDMLIRKW